jgi:hypothetical protein
MILPVLVARGRAMFFAVKFAVMVHSGLDDCGESDWIAQMKKNIVLILIGVLLTGSGCVDTVSGRKTAAVPFVKDTAEAKYPRPMNEVFEAAKDVVAHLGVLDNESTLYNQSNQVKTVEGRINQRNVWVRIEALEPNITALSVQARTKGGGSDLELAHQLDKEIALKLVVR